MNIQEAQDLRLLDLTGNHVNQCLKDYSQTKIKDLRLDDLLYLLRQRMYVEPLIKIIVNKIEKSWSAINVYYPDSELTEWFENTIKELILLPKRYWEIDKESFYKVLNLLIKNSKRKIKLEKFIVEEFKSYSPKEIEWTDNDWGELKIAIDNGNKVRVKTRGRNILISDSRLLKHLVICELSDPEDILSWLKNEKKLTY